MNKERFRRAMHQSVDRLVDEVLRQLPAPAHVYNLQLIGTKPLLSISRGDGFIDGQQVITTGEELFELTGGDWLLKEQYRRTKVT